MKKKFLAVLFAATMVISSAIPTYAADTDIKSDLIAKFEFEENLTNNVENGKDAKVVAKGSLGPDAPAADYTFTYVDGVTGKAIYFGKDGNTNGLNLNVAPKDALNYTVSVWVKATGCNRTCPIIWLGRADQSKGENWHGIWPGFTDNYQSAPCVGSNDKAGHRYAANPKPNEGLGVVKNEAYDKDKIATTQLFDWTMVTLVVEKGIAKLYYDGQLVAKSGDNEIFPDLNDGGDTTVSTYLAANYWDNPFVGYADSFYMYDRALTTEDVQALFNETHGNIPAGSYSELKEFKPQKPSRGTVPGVTYVEADGGIDPVVIGAIIAAVVAVVIVAVVVVSKSKKKAVDGDEE